MQAKTYEHIQIILRLLGRINLLRAAWRIYETVKMADFRSLCHNVRYWGKTAPDGLPIPPSKFIVLVAGTADIPWFLNSDKLGAESIRGALEKMG